MAFCTNCGHQLTEGDKYCFECGAKVNVSPDHHGEKRTIVYSGRIHKCPNCGEIINSFVAMCPSCGYEIRENQENSAVQILFQKLEKAESNRKRETYIRNFFIPNTKEDITEFVILAGTNLESKDGCQDAWLAKLHQVYQKAKLTFGDSPEFEYVKKQYRKSLRKTYVRKIAVEIQKFLAGFFHILGSFFSVLGRVIIWFFKLLGRILIGLGKVLKAIVTSNIFKTIIQVILFGIFFLVLFLIFES